MSSCCKSFATEAKHRIDIQSKTSTPDNYGGNTISWVTLTTVWAIIKPKSGNSVFMSQQLQSKVTHEVVIRYKADFADTKDFAAYRILIDGRPHSIKYLMNLDRDMENYGKDYQKILTEENGALAQ